MIPVFALATWGWTSPHDANDSPSGQVRQDPYAVSAPTSTQPSSLDRVASAVANELGRLAGGE